MRLAARGLATLICNLSLTRLQDRTCTAGSAAALCRLEIFAVTANQCDPARCKRRLVPLLLDAVAPLLPLEKSVITAAAARRRRSATPPPPAAAAAAAAAAEARAAGAGGWSLAAELQATGAPSALLVGCRVRA